MSSIHAPSRPQPAASNGRAAAPVADVRPPGRRVRVPELVIGVLVTALFALGAVLWHLSSIEKVPAIAASTSIARGDLIESGDIRVVYVSSDASVARLDTTQVNRLIGHVALIDVEPGTLLTPSMVADAVAIGQGEGVVGLSLDPGAYPARGLAPGDRVNVVRTADVGDPGADRSVVARGATVFAIEELSSDRLLVSVLASQADAEAVAAAAGNGGLRLVLVSS